MARAVDKLKEGGPGVGRTMLVLHVLCCFIGCLIGRQPQPQPSPYTGSRSSLDKQAYKTAELTNVTFNSHIKRSSPEYLRIATYNIHMHKDIFNRVENNDALMKDLRIIDPVIVLFEEVVSDGDPLRKVFDDGLERLGFKYRYARRANNARVGNMIASKIPVHNARVTEIGHFRCIVEGDIEVYLNKDKADDEEREEEENPTKIRIAVTHWDHSYQNNADRLENSRALIKHFKNYTGPLVLAGDFNCQSSSEEMRILLDSAGFTSSFNALHWPSPRYTCWAGTEIDFILLCGGLESQIKSSYTYHTVSSDHIPVLVDLNMRAKESYKATSRHDNSSPITGVDMDTFVLWCALVAAFILSGAVSFYVFINRYRFFNVFRRQQQQ